MLSDDAPVRIRMEHITKRYGAVLSLDDVSLEVRAGEVLGLVGDNGAGKSTLMKVLSGAVIPDTGKLLLRTINVSGFGSLKQILEPEAINENSLDELTAFILGENRGPGPLLLRRA